MSDTVANVNDPAVQPGEEIGAQDELDTLLAQYDEAQKPQGEPQDDTKELINWVKEQKTERESEIQKQGISDSVKSVRESLDFPLPERVIEGYLHKMANDDPRINQAFRERKSNPDGWKRVLKSVTKSLQKDFSDLPDAGLTKDRDVVTAAVRSASTAKVTTEEAPDFSKMNKNQLDNYLRGLG